MKKQQKFPPAPARCWDEPEGTSRVWALLVHPVRDDSYPSSRGGYRHLKFDVVSVSDVYDKDARKIRNETGNEAIRDLVIHSQGDTLRPDELYGYGLEYRQIFSLDRREAEQKFRFLSTFERKMERAKQEHGPVYTFEQWMIRACKVLDIHYIIEKRTDSLRSWESYDEGAYRYFSLRSDGRFSGQECSYTVQRLVRDLWTETDRAAAKADAEEKAEQARQEKEIKEQANG